MALDVPALEAALPAALILAVSGAPAGLVTAATQVYVGRLKRTAAITSPEAWFRPGDPQLVEGGLGHARREVPYDLTIEKTSGTHAELVGWIDGVERYFNGRCRPYVTGLWAVRVEDLDVDLHEGEGPAVACRARLVFREV